MPDAVPTFRRRATRSDKQRPSDAARPPAHQRGYDHNHRKWRALVLENDPVCHWPMGSLNTYLGDTLKPVAPIVCREPATVADHIVPLTVAPGRALDLDNGQGLCHRHHTIKTNEEKRGVFRSTR